MNPLVSICIPTYNGAQYLEEALISIECQTYRDFEVVVSDDASTDATMALVEAFQQRNVFPVRIVRHEPKGIGANWNHCVAHAKGAYIKFLFQDDVMEPSCIEKMVAMMESSDNVGLVYCRRSIIYGSLGGYEKHWLKSFEVLHNAWDEVSVVDGVQEGICYLSDRNLMQHPLNKIGEPTASLIARSCFDKVGFFNETLEQVLDVEFWLRLFPFYKVGFVDEALVGFRLHSNQASQINAQKKIDGVELKTLQGLLWKHHFLHLHPSVQLYLIKVGLNLGRIKRYFKQLLTH
ncbi:glycosyltransferase family 2 protein [Mangrovimonas xylaniphaga]|uniref:glycosyltransferase family 2 protein n=1 Tax=Mangrovimonas xylaniphaga TaxID=1645915 RepID=UPI0006B542F4|nr:glycosyltransferase family 2 protein [Mangrovimonas xylaniphaga]